MLVLWVLRLAAESTRWCQVVAVVRVAGAHKANSITTESGHMFTKSSPNSARGVSTVSQHRSRRWPGFPDKKLQIGGTQK